MTDVLFSPIKVGSIELGNRIVLAPLTRFRNDDDGSPNAELAPEHYAERCLVPGTLLIAEATDVSKFSGSYANVPGLYTEKQIEAWKKVTDAVHAKKGYIFVQLWALGRVNPGNLVSDVVGASPIPDGEGKVPRELTEAEILEYEDAFVEASKAAIKAGFDGVEIHGAHGYLVDQFIQDVSNQRTDKYGGSVENRARFALEIVEKVSAAIGPEHTGIRLSPFSQFQGMKMTDPYPTFSYIISKLQESYPSLAYLHVVEPRVSGGSDREAEEGESTAPYHKLWKGAWIAAGGFTAESAKEYAAQYPEKTLIAFGRYFTSNPDLVAKIKEGIPLVPYEREKFYVNKSPVGYLDYKYAPELKGKYY
ncbi:uncharacterized protein V1516DRAFT_662903 [Lipomyces oligophaga]|uniref:uncharacterized protein n=1 Tax=Lipomyces oligophaga TaxID=45792 RepID=UPI0034CDF54E